ncbi:WecB/TagA/CpsF family glycosyltransferase [Lebetimonas sp. JH292]|uniref:WecB/TagA/CpsF family glycosyltransferase n=1 Tax=Lebetimonas sp. JH292 TaxID=990068 RepID=UPI00350EDB9A
MYAGVKKRAPNWMQKYSLEWLYRLIQDPKRLWKRYLYTNLLFFILKQCLKYKILKI